MNETEGTFLVSESDAETAILTDVATSQVHTLGEQPDPPLEPGEVIVGTLVAEPPTTAIYAIESIDERRTIPVEYSDESPTKQEHDIAADQSVGELTRQPRAGKGELHVLTVPDDRTEQAARDVIDDRQTVARAARLGVDRVEVRAAEGVLSVRYLPE
ncbi:DUF5812 family protein [Halapricum hydrolyticum]|uniref:DUF5812 family protein n=1 Tax=Halapricum hydrolyticum TaxID=2979991 RepID=A0AAE3LJ07_9EURY|nr:DUF5812 family protein [Halapricum hydrolyticum]MCU4717613.1 DUF5812 family protein [Halapricum hydrolyticum]MCU4726858.1 DUF5812 family protein [Halapricum hydrolyticum]